ncbi:GGDEF domain-containing protein [Oceanobacillus limi]|uniref:GGDEF domain-containing protein n=1 Tax=Oceanobacillus limi TaxID=930131 RepID=UPI001FCDD441|nr:GGDEF domain-containing protein [Oceanobacillus limi]
MTTPIDFYLIIIMFSFQTLALLSIGLMQNDANRNYLYRNELEYYSRRDSITNLYNLRHFKNKVEQLIESKQRKPFYIAMIDVDFFKQYNDTHGHPAGDKVLRTVGELLTENLRSEDLFARYGGEEFIICLPNLTKSQTAYEIVDQFREAVEKYKFKGDETQPTGKITVSIGLSGESKGKTLDVLINEADQALYIAKKDGRNNTAFFK